LQRKYLNEGDSIMGLFGWLTGTDKYGAARSALIAKYIFEQFDRR
jgi:hypothetical protein